MMVGRSLGSAGPPREAPPSGDARLELDACSAHRAGEPHELDDVSLTVGAGEIVCLAGVEGNGQRALSQILFGLRRPSTGSALVDGRPIPEARRWRREGVRVARVPEDRRHLGLDLEAPLWRNLLMGPMAPRHRGVVRQGAILAWARDVLLAFGVSPPDPRALAGSLSGGNQQKVVLARELAAAPRAVVAVNPTRGLDVAAQGDVYERLERMRAEGMATLVISTDLDEVLRLADRVGVLYGGRLEGPLAREEVTRERLGLLMAGAGEVATG
jgi:simple sugar transport system ATP-binding protein